MFKNARHLQTGDVTQVNTRRYEKRGRSSITVKDGGRYTKKMDVLAKEYHHHEPSGGNGDTLNRYALNRLHEHIAAGALHSSDERVDAPKCHEYTREAVQQDILSRLSGGDHSRDFVWLTGPAGAGKTAIVGTLCDKLRADGRLAATFYFSSHKGSVNRMSKRFFVTTLAYQLQRHPALKKRISSGMMLNIQQDPALFEMSLQEQAEALILQPLRDSQESHGSALTPPLIIAIDGVDECGEDNYGDSNRSREKDQIEVLSILLQAIHDPAFPCHIIVASRPEHWIRRFFEEAAVGRVAEIFLDDRYSPDDDIALYLKLKFSELGRRHGYDPSTWPKEVDIEKLVVDASGQFVYAATVIRFVDSAWPLPKQQLEIVLNIRPSAGSSPFRTLDALYTAILNTSPSPADTVLWLRAIQRLEIRGIFVKVSAWTINRLFESSEGQAGILLRLPSLIYKTKTRSVSQTSDFLYFSAGAVISQATDSDSAYSFYHKSFLDFLGDSERRGAGFPDVDDSKVERWIWERISKALECNGPEIPIDHELHTTFTKCLMRLLVPEAMHSEGRMTFSQDVLSKCDPSLWPLDEEDLSPPAFLRYMFVSVHKECRLHRPCGVGCKRWRKEILGLQGTRKGTKWDSLTLLLDRFCINRISGNGLHLLYRSPGSTSASP